MKVLTLFLLTSCWFPGTGFCQGLSFQRPLDVGNGLQVQNYVPANGIAVGDFNGDGKADLVVVNSPAGFKTAPLTVSLGNGDGTFQPAKIVAGVTTLTGRPVVGDFNGDGFLDIAFVETFNSGTTPSSISTRSTVDVLLGKGDGTFRPALVTSFPPSTGPVFGTNVATPLITADLNRDGHLDLISLATIFIGNGDGTFTPFPTFIDGDAIFSSDFNHDGIPDLLIIQPNQNAAVILGTGNGTFSADVPIPVKFSPGSFAAGDFNGDGIVDLAVSPTLTAECAMPVSFSCVPQIAGVAVLIGAGDGTFRTPITTTNAMGPIFGTADINEDGKLDLIVGNSVLAGVGDGTFRLPVSLGLSTTPCTLKTLLDCELLGYDAAVVADFNGDGKQDVAIAYATYEASLPGGVTVMLNNSPGDGFLVTGVSSASGAWPVDTNSMVTAYGNNLAPMAASAPDSASPPTTLGGIRVHLWDRITNADQLAPLFFVSPSQINFLLTAADKHYFHRYRTCRSTVRHGRN